MKIFHNLFCLGFGITVYKFEKCCSWFVIKSCKAVNPKKFDEHEQFSILYICKCDDVQFLKQHLPIHIIFNLCP